MEMCHGFTAEIEPNDYHQNLTYNDSHATTTAETTNTAHTHTNYTKAGDINNTTNTSYDATNTYPPHAPSLLGPTYLAAHGDRRVVVGRHHDGALGKILKVLICVLLGIGMSSDWLGWLSWSSWGSSLGSGGS